jgi:hypothetical protein
MKSKPSRTLSDDLDRLARSRIFWIILGMSALVAYGINLFDV